MPRIADVIACLEDLAPPALAEEWDNTGLLIGDRQRDVSGVLTCLTLTPDVAAEAVRRNVQLVVAHHPVLFRPVQRLTADAAEGRMLLDLIAAGVAVYSPHTAWDTSEEGINRQLADLFEMSGVTALRSFATEASNQRPAAPGTGRCGNLPGPVTLGEFLERVKQRLSVERLHYVGELDQRIERLGIACGSAADFLRDAHRLGCQALLTGEARFHACLEARALGMALILPGHYATERPAMEELARRLSSRFPALTVEASRVESDPVRWA